MDSSSSVVVPVVEPVVDPVPPVVDPVIISIADLQASHDLVVQKEATHRALVAAIANPDKDTLTASLYQWARLGFPAIFPITTVALDVPATCADGVSRSFFDYVQYLLGTTITEQMLILEARLPGMTLSYSLAPSSVTIHVTKA